MEITTITCPLCGKTINRTFSGWFCAKAGCGFAAPAGTPDEFDLLASLPEIPKSDKEDRLVKHLVIGDTILRDDRELILSHDPVAIGSGIKLLRFTNGTSLKVMAHDSVTCLTQN